MSSRRRRFLITVLDDESCSMANSYTEDDVGQVVWDGLVDHGLLIEGVHVEPFPPVGGGEHDGRICTASVREPAHFHAPECPRRKVDAGEGRRDADGVAGEGRRRPDVEVTPDA